MVPLLCCLRRRWTTTQGPIYIQVMFERADRHVQPRLEQSALITIDVQCDVLDGGPFEVAGTTTVLPRLARLTRAFRRARRPIVHVVRLYLPDGSNVDLCRKQRILDGALPFCPDTSGAQLAPEVLDGLPFTLDAVRLLRGEPQTVMPDEVVLYKPRWGAFYGTALEAWLRSRDVSTLVFAGCNFPNCPRTSIYEASERDFRLVLVDDAVSGLYEKGVQELSNIGVFSASTSFIEAHLKPEVPYDPTPTPFPAV